MSELIVIIAILSIGGPILIAYLRIKAIQEANAPNYEYTNSRNTTLTTGVWKCTCGKEVSNKDSVCTKCGSWKCKCDSINAKNAFYCKCGNWICVCGLVNTPVSGTCSCGKRKRDAEMATRNNTI
ncbi:MAG: hypothetical protein IK020_10165 [Clostridiales bacterium]|nr:hypothetical protein [Clostridiales bacterium]